MTEAQLPGRGALAGLRVVEAGHLIAGPFCGHLFADHGAEVVKVEPRPAGDPMREWGGRYRGVGLYWPLIAREKKSVTCDLRRREGQTAFEALVASADVVIENFRPGTFERWGLGWERLREINPRLVMVRVTGYGQSGPYRDRTGFGSVGEAMGGLRHITGESGRPPVRVGISIGDALAATHGFTGALMALYARDRPGGSGSGQMVDVALYEAIWMYMESTMADFDKLGRTRERSGALLPGIAPSSVYPTADDEWVVIGANQDSVFRRLAEALGRPDWIADGASYSTHEGRGRAQTALDDAIAEWTRQRPTDTVLEIMNQAGVPAGRIYSAADIAVDAHYRAREMVVRIPEPNLDDELVAMPGIVPKLSETPGRVTRGGPRLGEHNDEVWPALLGDARLEELKCAGVV
jgi:crotonobetainyl-CoA:carnitine CoA-transferase CaiB-like acyl-CoA transferase